MIVLNRLRKIEPCFQLSGDGNFLVNFFAVVFVFGVQRNDKIVFKMKIRQFPRAQSEIILQ